MFTLGNVIALSLVLFCIGAYGVLARRNLIIVLISVEIMLNAANLVLVAFSRHFAEAGAAPLALPGAEAMPDAGQVFVLMSMGVAAAEVAVGLALLIAVFRARGSIMSTDAAELRG